MPPTYVMLLWHMHQPFYKDLAEDLYAMPWVRLHALKDYYGMVAVLKEFPNVHVTFNLVPSLLAQLNDYAQETAREEDYEIAFRPVEALTREARERLLDFAFRLNRDNLLYRYPRFRELFERARATRNQEGAARLFTLQDLLDLQVLSQLAWFDEIYLAQDPAIRALTKKGRGYSEADKVVLRKKGIEIFKVTLEEYAEASRRGQVEISTSPFYHPILPLLCDTNVAVESHPGVKLPRRRFQHPEDARAQLRAAVELHERFFGTRPRGLWPSEGSVSDEVLALAMQEGFEWTATDEGVLGRSLQVGFYRQADGTMASGQELYRPHRFVAGDKGISIFFRDHQLSDLIGFVYSRIDAQAAAADLHQRIRAAGRSMGNRPALISIILDGENAWEFFPGNGREFLRAFYGRLASDSSLRAVTASEALGVTEPGKLTHVVPGSWISANFDIWIGADEDNRAWDLLSEARDFFAAKSGDPRLDPAKVRLAEQELWIAEGSDWCWWYGPEHSSGHDEEFDRLFRTHLSNIYRLLGGSPPDQLAVPIKRPAVKAKVSPPTGRIAPRVDGQVTSYFEWLGAGVYSPDYRSSSMHGGAQCVDALYFGNNDRALYVRLDLVEKFREDYPQFEVRVNVDGENRARIQAWVEQGKLGTVQFWRRDEQMLVPLGTGNQLQVAFNRIFELRLDYALAGHAPGQTAHFQVSLWAEDLPLQVIPPEGWLTLELTEDLTGW
ncbi:MAG: glycoside hydrolase [Acidobacteriia bacterium]|nr:glycoside hydrolase [Terriglobia bacterium]